MAFQFIDTVGPVEEITDLPSLGTHGVRNEKIENSLFRYLSRLSRLGSKYASERVERFVCQLTR